MYILCVHPDLCTRTYALKYSLAELSLFSRNIERGMEGKYYCFLYLLANTLTNQWVRFL